MHVPVVGDILQAKAIGADSIFEALRRLCAHLVKIVFGKRVHERHRRLANLTTLAKDLIKWRVLADVPARVGAVEDLLPLSQRVRFAKHKRADDQRFDVGHVTEHPQRVAASVPAGKYYAVFSHFFDASQDAVSALLQVIAYEIDGLHGLLQAHGEAYQR